MRRTYSPLSLLLCYCPEDEAQGFMEMAAALGSGQILLKLVDEQGQMVSMMPVVCIEKTHSVDELTKERKARRGE